MDNKNGVAKEKNTNAASGVRAINLNPNSAASAPKTPLPASAAPAASTASAVENPNKMTPPREPNLEPLKFKAKDANNWRSRQDDPFAAQNLAAAEKKRKQAKTRSIAIPLAIVCVVLMLAGGVVWFVLAKINQPEVPETKPPEISNSTPEAIYDYRDTLEQIYKDSGGSMTAVNEAIDQTLATENGKENADAIRLAQINLLMNNSNYTSALEIGKEINADSLDLDQKIIYYNIMSNCSAIIDPESEDTVNYRRLMVQYSTEKYYQEGGQ